MSNGNRDEQATADWLRQAPQYTYMVELTAGKRVLELGCGRGVGAHFLANHGAAHVIGIDRSAEAVRHASSKYRQTNLEFRCDRVGAIELEDSSVDCIMVPDGSAILRRKGVLDELRRVLDPSGHLVFSVRSADRPSAVGGITYRELNTRLSPMFSPVRVVAQTPFIALALVQMGDDDGALDVELDTSLSGGSEDPTTYLAVCGGAWERPGLSLLHVPAAPGLEVAFGELGRDFRAEHRAASRAVQDDGALTELRAAIDSVQRERDAAEDRVASLSAQLEHAQTEIGRITGDASVEIEQTRADMKILREQLRDIQSSHSQADRDHTTEPSGSRDTSAAIVQLAGAMEAHAEHERALRLELRESGAYAEELYEEQERLRGELEQAALKVSAAEARATELRAEVNEWRDRTARAEGELLKSGAGKSAEGSDALRTELEETRAELERMTANWKEAESKNDEVWRRVGALQEELETHREKAVESSAEQRKQAQLSVARAMDEASKKLVTVQDELISVRAELERSIALRSELEGHLEEAETIRARLESQVSVSSEPPLAVAVGPGAVDESNGLAGQILRIELELDGSRRLLKELEQGLQELARNPPSGYTTTGRSRELAVELGIKDAEMTFLNIGISTLQARLQQAADRVRAARARMEGLPASEMAAIMDRLSADLAALAGAD